MPAGTSADYRRAPNASGESAGRSRDAPRRGWGGVLRVLRIGAGFLLLVLGVIGLFLPVLQGVLMILAGLAVLGRDLPRWGGFSRAITERLANFVRRRGGGRGDGRDAR